MVSFFSSLSGHRERKFSDNNLQEVDIVRINKTEVEVEGRFELKLMTDVFNDLQEFTVFLKEISDSYQTNFFRCWTINLLLDVLLCSIAENVYSLILF